MALGSYDAVNCGVFPIHNVRISSPPAHGVAQVASGTTKLGDNTGVCKGKPYKTQGVVYRSSGKYAGPDRLTISWSAPATTENVRMTERSLTVEITVK